MKPREETTKCIENYNIHGTVSDNFVQYVENRKNVLHEIRVKSRRKCRNKLQFRRNLYCFKTLFLKPRLHGSHLMIILDESSKVNKQCKH